MLYVLAREQYGGTGEEFDTALSGLSGEDVDAFLKSFKGRLSAVG